MTLWRRRDTSDWVRSAAKTLACADRARLNAWMSPTRTAATRRQCPSQRHAQGEVQALTAGETARRTLGELEVGPERLLEDDLAEDPALGDLAEEELDENGELVRVLEEARRGAQVGRPAADRLEERGVRGRVVELDRADAACEREEAGQVRELGDYQQRAGRKKKNAARCELSD